MVGIGPKPCAWYEEGGDAFTRYDDSFRPHAVEQVLARHPNSVIDIGGFHTVLKDPEAFLRVQSALAPYRNVTMLLPSRDMEVSLCVLKARRHEPLVRWVLNSPCNGLLAKHTVYVDDKSPDQVRDEVIALCT